MKNARIHLAPVGGRRIANIAELTARVLVNVLRSRASADTPAAWRTITFDRLGYYPAMIGRQPLRIDVDGRCGEGERNTCR